MPLAVLAAAVLYGSVSIGPLTPVCRAGTPCSGPAKHVRLTFTHGVDSRTVTTTAAGAYRVTLAPGTWQVRASAGERLTPAAVVVRAGTHRANFGIDTGIR